MRFLSLETEVEIGVAEHIVDQFLDIMLRRGVVGVGVDKGIYDLSAFARDREGGRCLVAHVMRLNIKYKYRMSEKEVSFDGTQEQKSGVLFMKQSGEKLQV